MSYVTFDSEKSVKKSSVDFSSDISPFTSPYSRNETALVLEVTGLTGYRLETCRWYLWCVGCILSLGLLVLLDTWLPEWFLELKYNKCDMKEADYVYVKTEHDSELVAVEEISIRSYSEAPRRFFELLPAALPLGSGVPLTKRMFVFRYLRFIYNINTSEFEPLDTLKSLNLQDTISIKKGLSSQAHLTLLSNYGHNTMNVLVTPFPRIFMTEVVQPFFVFQIYSVTLWFIESYTTFAIAIFVMATVSVVITIKETREALQRIATMSEFHAMVKVIRSGEVVVVDSSELVIGDVVVVEADTAPCDLALIQGSVVVNESMLTGESIPIIKTAFESKVVANLNESQHLLFAATKVLQLKPHKAGTDVLAVVIRSGFLTEKGKLILSILYPRPSFFKFVTQTYWFIGFLFVIAFVGMAFVLKQMSELGYTTSLMIVRGLDLITIVVPPSLPLSMSVGANFALMCLRGYKMFCISPGKINMAGKVKLFCFDKTGTLTTETLDVLGVRQCKGNNFLAFDSNLQDHTLTCLSTCHSLTTLLLPNESKLVGDPLDIIMFNYTGSVLRDALKSDVKQSVCIKDKVFNVLSQFEFQSVLRRSSVIVESDSKLLVFCKGSPESILPLLIKSSLPSDFNEELRKYTLSGYRVIALAYKLIDSLITVREVVESDLIFLGFLVLENKLKPETASTLQILKDASIRCVMITGDNALTGVSVAKESGLISPGSLVFVGSIVQSETISRQSSSQFPEIEWICSSDPGLKLHARTLLPDRNVLTHPVELAITGDVFDVLYREYVFNWNNFLQSKATVQRKLSFDNVLLEDVNRNASVSLSSKKTYEDSSVRDFLESSFFHKVMVGTQVFSRMTPLQKADVIIAFQQLGLYVGFCGDGANDCVALKAAHVGVSLSESDASIAAPFTCLEPNISCVPKLLLEGRSSLVTSFQLFRFMAMYSIIQFTATILSFYASSVLGTWQYLYQDLAIVFPLTILMGTTLSSSSLTSKRPSGSLLSTKNLISMIGHMLICVSFQTAVYKQTSDQPGYVLIKSADNGAFTWETTSVYLMSNLQYSIVSLLFAIGYPWKQLPHKNLKLIFWWFLVTLLSILLAGLPKTNFFFTTDDVDIPIVWRQKILLYALGNMLVSWIYELLIIPFFSNILKSSHRVVGSEFGKGVPKWGSYLKPFHKLRQDFESSYSLVSSSE